MSKFFVVSDIHSFYTPLKTALDAAGFDPNNKDHWLVVCGDAFDRGDESFEVLHFLMSLERKILIRGNHEDLLEDCCRRGFPEWHDSSNGTRKTIQDIGGVGNGIAFDECCQITWDKMSGYRNLLVDYFETEKYIFVHGWIPCIKTKGLYDIDKYNPNWRKCNDSEWEDARWTNGIERAMDGIIEPGKTIVCGHWHCSLGHLYDAEDKFSASEFGETAVWDPWYHDGCIAIDRCTAHTGEVNVLVLEDEFLEGANGDD